MCFFFFYLSTFAGSLGALTAGLTLGTITQSTRLWFLYTALTGITDVLQIHVWPLRGEFVPHWKGLIECSFFFFRAFVVNVSWTKTHKSLMTSSCVGHRLNTSCSSATRASAVKCCGVSREATLSYCWSPADRKKLLWMRISPIGLKKLFTAKFIIFNYPALNPHLRYLLKENEGMHASKHLCCALFNSASRLWPWCRLKC